MSPGDPAGWADVLAELRGPFVRGSLERLDRMRQLLDALDARGDDVASLAELSRHFHGLGGAGGAYGFERVTALGRKGEAAIAERLREGGAGNGDVAAWRALVRGLHEDLLGGGDGGVAEVPAASLAAGEAPGPDVLVVDDEGAELEPLASLMEKEGFRVRTAASLAQARAAIGPTLPAAAIVDVRLPDGDGLDLVRELREAPGGDEVVLLIASARGELLDRVEAIRAGADGYFRKPVDAESLLRRLRHLLERPKTDPPRVLYVEDDPDQAAYVRAVLEPAGYEVRSCEDPTRFEVDLQAFRPDLLLVDVFLPGVLGTELVKLVRQDEALSSLPVVFLTGTSQLGTRIESARAGGDDYLVKPVPPALLLSTVAARLERARFLETLLHSDGLTRALTHTAFIERSRALVLRERQRPGGRCVLVMLDLDRFKEVNDTFGHPVGDLVLVSLARFLRRRLRRSDTVGRYGGEEFALLLPDLELSEAAALVEALRADFASLEQRTPRGEVFHVTFSAGLSLLDAAAMDYSAWHRTADEALYEAKKAGRNRVRTATAGVEGRGGRMP